MKSLKRLEKEYKSAKKKYSKLRRQLLDRYDSMENVIPQELSDRYRLDPASGGLWRYSEWFGRWVWDSNQNRFKGKALVK